MDTKPQPVAETADSLTVGGPTVGVLVMKFERWIIWHGNAWDESDACCLGLCCPVGQRELKI
jgi:hypothetical protein